MISSFSAGQMTSLGDFPAIEKRNEKKFYICHFSFSLSVSSGDPFLETKRLFVHAKLYIFWENVAVSSYFSLYEINLMCHVVSVMYVLYTRMSSAPARTITETERACVSEIQINGRTMLLIRCIVIFISKH